MEPKKSIRSGEIKLGDLIIKVHVLEDGQRVVEEQSVIKFMEYLENGTFDESDAMKFAEDLGRF